MTITLTSANSPYTFSGSTSSSGIVVTNTYAAGFDPVLINSGTIRETGVTQVQENDIAVVLYAGDTTGKTSLQNSGLISAAGYGVEIRGGSAGHYNRATITNTGTIFQSGDSSASSSGILFSTDTGGAVINSGFIAGTYGGIYFKTGDSGSKTVINNAGGTITNSTGAGRAVTFNDLGNLPGSSATFVNAGLVSGLVEFDVANGGATATNAGTISGRIISSQGGGTLTLDAGQTITGGANFTGGATLNFGAGTVAIGNINPAGTYVGFSAATILAGADFNIGSVGSSFSLSNVTSIGDFGTLNVAGLIAGTSINLEGNVAGSAGVVDFTGTNTATPIYNYANNDEIIIGTLALAAPAAGSSFLESYNTATGVLTTSELNAAGVATATSNITVTGAPGTSFTSSSFDVVTGPGGETIVLATGQINSGSIYLDYGEHATLANSALDNVNVTFGTHGSLTGPNVLALNGVNQLQNVNGNTYYASNAGTISGFGLNDVITLGTASVGALPTDVLTYGYDATTGRYQIFDQSEYQRTQNTNLSTASFYFSPAGSYSATSFVETYGTNGINVETQATDAEQGYTFNATGTADINTIRDYSSLVAPGSSIVSGEVVTIASGTATFASANAVPIAGGTTYASTFQNSGTILVSGTASTFSDYATLTGAGTIAAVNGGHINILDTSGGTDAAQTLLFGTGGTSLALNTIDLNATSGTFAGTIAGFGLNDDLIIGPSLLPNDNSFGSSINNYVTLAYAGSLLTVGEVEYPPGGAGTPTTIYTTINVGTGYSVGSFVALFGTNGINIETTSTVLEAPLTLSPVAGATTVSFADPTQYAGGLAPGGSIIAGESIIINAGTALVQIQRPESNSGNIIINSGTLQNNAGPTGMSDLTGTGTITIQNGGKFAQSVTGGTNTIAFGGDNSANYNMLAVGVSATSFTSPITGFGSNDEIILLSPVLPTPGSASNFTNSYNSATGALVVSEFNGGGTLIGMTTLTVANTGSLNASSFVDVTGFSTVAGSPAVDVFLGSTTLLSTTGSIVIDNGHSVTLSNTGGIDTIPVTFGTHGSIGAFNTLDINGSVSGTNSPYQGSISGFGLNDDIIIGPSTLPSLATGSSVTLSYAGSLLTVGEVNSGGTVTASTTINVGPGYAANSFVALLGTNGINIETPATVLEQSFTFQSAYNSTGNINQLAGNFEDPTLYKGGLAPGSSIVAGETVTVLPTSLAQLTTPLNNSGVIILSGSSANLQDNAPITGNGTILVTGGADFVDTSPTGVTTNTIAFGPTVSGVTNIAYLDTPGTAGFAGVIANFGPGDNIDLGSAFLPTPTSASNISLSFAGGILSIFDTVNGTIYTDMLTISGTVPGTFSAALGTMPDGSTGIVLSDIPCFAAGTRILTGTGQVVVERLAVGDKVLTVRDGAEAEIVWVGQRTVDLTRHAMPEKARPVRILAGAFGEGLPERDLRLSPDHALFIDGHLIEAKTLVNGVTVIEEMNTRFVTYHHIELATHDVVLAEGLAAESYLESGNRMMFEGDAVPMMLHPDFAAVSRAKACAPLAVDGDVVVAARRKILERAVALGFTATGAVDLTAHVAGVVVAPEMDGDEMLFVLPNGAESVELVSSVGVPAETSALPGDRRVLGVAVTGLALIVGGKRMVIALDDAAHTGFYEMENGHRWTNGAAQIALPAYSGKAVLEVTINGQAMRWVSAA